MVSAQGVMTPEAQAVLQGPQGTCEHSHSCLYASSLGLALFWLQGKPKGKADAGWSSVGAWVFVGTAATKEIIY